MTFRVPFRVRVGITGHRDLRDTELLTPLIPRALDAVWTSMFDPASRRMLDRAKETPKAFAVISSLAEGADRLVTRIASARDGTVVDAVLPLSDRDYHATFETEESRAEFSAMISGARRVFRVRNQDIDSEFSVDDRPVAKARAFETAGRFVVDHCDVLLAVWDGSPTQKRGGTAHAVEYARLQQRPLIIVWDSIKVELGRGLSAAAIGGIERLNTVSLSAKMQTHLRRPMLVENVPRDLRDKLSSRTIGAIQSTLLPSYLRASELAKRYQNTYVRAGFAGYSLAAGAVAAAAVAILFPGIAPLAFCAELACLVGVWLAARRAHKSGAQHNWIESRYLAERLRGGFYLGLLGVEPVRIPLVPFEGMANDADDWVVRAFDEISAQLPTYESQPDIAANAAAEFIRTSWLPDQITFHEDKARTEGLKGARLLAASKVLFGITIAIAMGHLLLPLVAGDAHAIELLHAPLSWLAIVLPAVGGALAGLRSHREHFRLERRSRNMGSAMRLLATRFSSVETWQQLRDLLHETDELTIREAEEWMVLMRDVRSAPG